MEPQDRQHYDRRRDGPRREHYRLDTVKPGLVQYDIGDCLRSCCNPWADAQDLDAVTFELDYLQASFRLSP